VTNETSLPTNVGSNDQLGPNQAERVDWMPEARQMAAQCWCDEDTKHTEMDGVLAEAVARRIAAWMETGAFHARNEAYWRERAEKAESAARLPENATEPMQKAMQRSVMLRKSMNDVWRAALSELGA
jgi:hypothetical protein